MLLLYFQCIAIEDINPQAPVHFLVIPKKEIRKITDTSDEDEQVCLPFCLFSVHLPLDFYMPVVFKNIKVLLLLQVKFTGWVNYLIPLRGLLSQPGIWVGVCHGHPGSLSPFVYNVGSHL